MQVCHVVRSIAIVDRFDGRLVAASDRSGWLVEWVSENGVTIPNHTHSSKLPDYSKTSDGAQFGICMNIPNCQDILKIANTPRVEPEIFLLR